MHPVLLREYASVWPGVARAIAVYQATGKRIRYFTDHAILRCCRAVHVRIGSWSCDNALEGVSASIGFQ
jgi:hypothetical protein